LQRSILQRLCSLAGDRTYHLAASAYVRLLYRGTPEKCFACF
jgi:hypothetical protein